MDFNVWSDRYCSYIFSLAGDSDGFSFIGGTALSLGYLQHRISEDLDFALLDHDRSTESIPRTISQSINAEYEHVETMTSWQTGDWMGDRFMMVDGENEVKIDVIKNGLVDDPSLSQFQGVPIFELTDLYQSKLRLVAGHAKGNEFGISDSRSRNIRDWLDVYELSLTHKNLGGFLLSEMDVDEAFVSDIDDSLSDVEQYDLKQEAVYLQYDRSFTKQGLIEHLDEGLDTWHGHQLSGFDLSS